MPLLEFIKEKRELALYQLASMKTNWNCVILPPVKQLLVQTKQALRSNIFAQMQKLETISEENDRIQRPVSPFQLFCKRFTDLALCTVTLLIFGPLMLLLAIAIKLDSSGPVIFKQKRVGKNGRYFYIYKFRTMATGTPDLPTDQMLKLPSTVTKVGKILRSTSLDELPQIFNVIKDEMSLVGPRPALYNQTELTRLREAAGVLRFAPGITGWAQVNGRDELPDDVKVRMDKWYGDNWNYFLDWKIIFMTVRAVLSRRGAV